MGLGAVVHAGRVAGPEAPLRRPHPPPARQAGGGTGCRRGGHRRDGRWLHAAVRHGGGHRDAGTWSLMSVNRELPAGMTAAYVTDLGPAESIQVGERPLPEG